MYQQFGSCVNALTTDYEIRWNALHRRCTSVRFSIIQPTRTPVRDGRPRVRERLVGRSVGGIKFLTLFRCAGSLGRRAF